MMASSRCGSLAAISAESATTRAAIFSAEKSGRTAFGPSRSLRRRVALSRLAARLAAPAEAHHNLPRLIGALIKVQQKRRRLTGADHACRRIEAAHPTGAFAPS